MVEFLFASTDGESRRKREYRGDFVYMIHQRNRLPVSSFLAHRGDD